MSALPSVTICVLTYGEHAALARRVLTSIWRNCERSEYQLLVGANAVGAETLEFLDRHQQAGDIDQALVSPTNLSKCPMMRCLFARVQTDYIWWFDDDSYITRPGVLREWLQLANEAPASTVSWGELGVCEHPLGFANVADVTGFVRSASWYAGLPPPSWRPGGKGEFDFRGLGRGDGRWFFLFGGCWLIRTATVRALDWPDPRLTRHGDDVFLGEAIRQQGWNLQPIANSGVAMSMEPRRGGDTPAEIKESKLLSQAAIENK